MCPIYFIFVILYYTIGAVNAVRDLPPLFLVHGLSGSKMWLSGENLSYPSWLNCANKSIMHHSWFSFTRFVGFHSTKARLCELNLLSPAFDESTEEFRTKPNVTISTTDSIFGDLNSVECLLSPHLQSCSLIPSDDNLYMRKLIKAMIRIGYEPEHNLWAPAYDWRMEFANNMLDDFYENLKLLIEKTVIRTRKQAILLGHSNGNNVLTYFLTMQSETWRKEFINEVICVAAPFGGAIKTAYYLSSGEEFRKLIVQLASSEEIKNISLASPSVYSNLPNPHIFGADTLFAEVNGTQYTVDRVVDFVLAVNRSKMVEAGTKIYSKLLAFDRLPPIGFYCIYGTNRPTITFMNYSNIGFEKPPKLDVGEGDGTVNYRSLSHCKNSPNLKKLVEFPGIEHTSILSSQNFHNQLAAIVKLHMTTNVTFPLLRNVIRHHGDYSCISQHPTRVCRQNQSVTESKVVKMAFVCLIHRSDIIYRAKNGECFFLTDYMPHLFRYIEVHRSCGEFFDDFD